MLYIIKKEKYNTEWNTERKCQVSQSSYFFFLKQNLFPLNYKALNCPPMCAY